MRSKNFNAGLRGVLFEAKHYQQMGQAVWLYGWLVLRQTRQEDTLGLVLGGSPVSYREIEEETGFARKTLERWMSVLRREGYVLTKSTPAGVIVRITKAKKWVAQATQHIATPFVDRTATAAETEAGAPLQLGAAELHNLPENSQFAITPLSPNKFPASAEPRPVPRECEAPQRKFADGSPQLRGIASAQDIRNATVAEGIGSGYVDRGIRKIYSQSHSYQNAETLGKTPPLQAAERPQQDRETSGKSQTFGLGRGRDEALRRELNVGAGPECRRRGK